MPEPIDVNGKRVLTFTGKVRNLARVAELTSSIVEIAKSGAWRDYRVATGHERWREAELDYFLIACDLHYDDVSRVLAWNEDAADLAPMMDRDANGSQRRSLEEAADAWHSPSGEALIDRARRLGWLTQAGKPQSPVPRRARAKAKHDVTQDEHARRSRMRRIPTKRRRELDDLADRLLDEVESVDERRYLIDRLAPGKEGRPATTPAELAAWRVDAEELEWKTAGLAERWNVDQSTARRRLRRLRESAETSLSGGG